MMALPPIAMTRLSGLWLAFVLAVALWAGGPAISAAAQSLEALRASGAVGERFDGYLELRDPAVAGAGDLVARVNGERRRIYETDAAAQGVSAQEIGRIYATKIWQKVPSGTWLLDESGKWRRK